MSNGQIPRQGRPSDPAKRQAIIVAAAERFFDAGFAASSIEQIASAAGVSKVTIYNHFGDKSTLFTAAVEHECEKLRSHLVIDTSGDGTLRTRLLALGEAIVAFLSRPELVKFERRIAAETEREPEVGLAFLNAGPRRIKASFALLLAGMAEAGELVIDDPGLAAEQFVSMCKGLGDLERRFGSANDPERNRERIEGAVEVFLRTYSANNDEIAPV